MKIAHISDLHLGKQLYSFSLTEDQEYILNKIVSVIKEQKVEVLLIAGDIFDKNVASLDGIKLFRKFLNDLVKNQIAVMIISGNHDSPERLTFGAEFMKSHKLYFSKVYDGTIEPVILQDEYGPVNFYLLPFIRPAEVKHFFPDEQIKSYEDAVKLAVKNLNIDKAQRNIILSHQAIINAQTCDSEESIIGGLDTISADIYNDFDYCALGHIHTPQKIRDNVIYCGSPLKYSTSEMKKDKSMPIIELGEKGKIEINYEPLIPLRDIREIKAKFYEIIEMAKKDPYNKEDYINIILTDENETMDALSTLRESYPNIIHLSYENSSTQNTANLDDIVFDNKTSPLELFEDFFENRGGRQLTSEEKDFMQNLIEKIWGDNL